jgi:hypothetical protein
MEFHTRVGSYLVLVELNGRSAKPYKKRKREKEKEEKHLSIATSRESGAGHAKWT